MADGNFLALAMRSSFFGLLLLPIFLGCTQNEKTSSVLNQPLFAALTDSIKQAPNSAELYYKRGVLLYGEKQIDYARADIEKAWSLEAKEEYGLSLYRLHKQTNIDSAIYFLETALQEKPNYLALQVALAKAYFEKNNFEKALALCNNILAQYPSQLDALLLKADVLTAQQNNGEATTVLEQAYLLAPFDAELAHQLAFKWAEEKNEKVLALSDSLLKADVKGTHAEPFLFKGIYYYNIKNNAAALKAFNDAIIKDYAFLDAHMYKGQLFYNEKKYAEAYKTFQLVTTITPTYADAYFWMAKCQEVVGNTKDALLNYQRAYELDKSLEEAKEAAQRLK